MSKYFRPQHRDKRGLASGLDAVIKDLKMRLDGRFYSFRIEHHPDAERPFPVDHELLELTITYNDHREEEVLEYVRSHHGRRWYQCEDYRKKGRPI